MRQFQVPQFITVEDKIIGPLTAKQFLFILGGIGIIALARFLLVSFLFFPIAIIVAAVAAALAFLKVNEIPFPTLVKNGFRYTMHPHIYIWKKEEEKIKQKQAVAKPDIAVAATPKLSESKLSDLAWSLNIKEKLRQTEEGESRESSF
ncbi:MAG: PrgI family protein [Candidatus Sungbacteria bacterium]|nr:PrgI family protein [bacterium]MDZ4260647.1 PrgI family protein [Candidatus Sungbacteria bacterium]